MSQTSSTITITDTATQAVTSNTDLKMITFTNTGSSVIYLGTDNSVTSSSGFPLGAGEIMKNNDYIGDWYGICATGESSTIRVDLEVVENS